MESTAEKEERKREYNRLAQREFRRRRKEHIKSLEQARKEMTSSTAEEMKRLRSENDDLRKENHVLRAQMYSHATSSHQFLSTTPSLDNRQYSLSPSISGTSMSCNLSASGSPPSMMVGSDYLPPPMGNFSISSSMMHPSLNTYIDHDMSSQSYSMVHYPSIRHSPQCSQESSGFRSSRNSVDSSPFKPVKDEGNVSSPSAPLQRHINGLPALTTTTVYDRNKARSELCDLFRPLISDPFISNDPQRHFAILRSMTDDLPPCLKPTKQQLETVHYYGIDAIASPSLRDHLLSLNYEVARNFVNELGIISSDNDDMKVLTIWGNDPLNEMCWEFSKTFLERWSWVVGNEWIQRTNFWRNMRQESPVPDW